MLGVSCVALTGPVAAMTETAKAYDGERGLRVAVASLTVPRWVGHPWRDRLTVERAAVIGRRHGLRSHRGTTSDQRHRPRLRARGDDAVCTAVGRRRDFPS